MHEATGLAARVDFIEAGWSGVAGAPFDLALSNPPYIPTADIDALELEVSRFEPRIALDGGADGLAAYRIIAASLPRLLRPGGAFALEVGAGQAEAVKALAEEAGLSTGEHRRDLAGIPRVVVGRAV